MASVESKWMMKILNWMNLREIFDKAFDSGNFSKGIVNEPPRTLRRKFSVSVKEHNKRKCFTITPKGGGSGKLILYLHGGGYVFGFQQSHWKLMDQLVQTTGCTLIAPDYPLAPDGTYQEVYDMLMPIYSDLLEVYGSERIILMGDSAGGGLALGLAQKRVAEQGDCADQLILLSPWLDLTLKNPEIKLVASRDPILSVKGLRRAAEAYSGGFDLSHFMLSPLYGSFEGLGKMSLFMGTNDLLEPDCRRLKAKLIQEQVAFNAFDYPEMPHVWILFNLPESKEALKQVVELINDPSV